MPAVGGPLLRAEAIHKSYPMGATQLEVLRNCDLLVGLNEFIAIMGKSGSGKSTLLHILGALDVPQGGQVYFRGAPMFESREKWWALASRVDVVARKLHRLLSVPWYVFPIRGLARVGIAHFAERRRVLLRRRYFGFVFQFYHLLPDLNVLENVLLPRMVATSTLAWGRSKRAARQDALDILQRVGLSKRIKHKPNELSGGECQRAAIARALVHKPSILFADEPTGNLDAEAGANIMSILTKLHGEGQTIVMVTHDPGIAEYADRVLVLESGRLHPA